MKKLLLLAVLAFAASAPAVPAFAGGCGGCSGGCCSKSEDGFSCMNQCPLAQQANTHRSTGREAACASPVCRAAFAAAVAKNLAKV